MGALQGQKFEIDLDGASIIYRPWTDDDSALWSYYPTQSIHSVIPNEIIGFGLRQADNQRRMPVRNDDKLDIQIIFFDDEATPLSFSLYNVMNQPGWTPDHAGMIQALQDINSWIASGSSSSASTDALLQDIIDQNEGSVETGSIDLVTADFPWSITPGEFNFVNIRVVSGSVTINGSAFPETAGTYIGFGANGNKTIDVLTIAEDTTAEVVVYTIKNL